MWILTSVSAPMAKRPPNSREIVTPFGSLTEPRLSKRSAEQQDVVSKRYPTQPRTFPGKQQRNESRARRESRRAW